MPVEVKKPSGNVTDIMKQTVDWLQRYFLERDSSRIPPLCIFSDSGLGK